MAEARCLGPAQRQTKRATIAALLCQGTQTLRAAGIGNARAEARLLLAHALGLDPGALLARAHDGADAPGFEALIARRAAREPAAYILGSREFWGMRFHVSPATLIPRPESETLIEAALESRPLRTDVRRVIDLGTGSGCLLCAALAEFPAASGLGVDASTATLDVARRNAAVLGLAARALFHEADWLAGIEERFDLVLANPPYVARGELPGLAPELAHEPASALVAGEDGLDAYRAILPQLPRVLAPEGLAILELGAGQADSVAALASVAGLRAVCLRHDLAGIARAIVLAASRSC